jgi:hypothetical protein
MSRNKERSISNEQFPDDGPGKAAAFRALGEEDYACFATSVRTASSCSVLGANASAMDAGIMAGSRTLAWMRGYGGGGKLQRPTPADRAAHRSPDVDKEIRTLHWTPLRLTRQSRYFGTRLWAGGRFLIGVMGRQTIECRYCDAQNVGGVRNGSVVESGC